MRFTVREIASWMSIVNFLLQRLAKVPCYVNDSFNSRMDLGRTYTGFPACTRFCPVACNVVAYLPRPIFPRSASRNGGALPFAR